MVPYVQSPDWLEFHATWIGEGTTVIEGGIDEASSKRSLLILESEVDVGAMLDLDGDGGTFYAQWLSVNPERGGSLDAGDIQIYSNIESDESRDDVYELWYEKTFESVWQRWKVGKVDANGEFALVRSGLEFAQSSAGFSPTVVGLPTYPDSAYSVNVFQDVSRSEVSAWTLAYGLYDGSLGALGVRTGRRGPETFVGGRATGDLFHVLQLDGLYGSEDEPLRQLSFGAWHHDGEFERADGEGVENGTTGGYAVWEEHFRGEGYAPMTVFGQIGWAEPIVFDFQRHYGLGWRVEGPMATRPDDSGGVYFSYADLGSAAEAEGRDGELAVDVFYRTAVMDHLVLQPEVHFVHSPSGDDGVHDAWIASLRVEVSF